MTDKDVQVHIVVNLEGFSGDVADIRTQAKFADHDYFWTQVLDVDKVRAEAYTLSKPDYYRKKGETSMIHFHRFHEPCDYGTPGGSQKHEFYPVLEG